MSNRTELYLGIFIGRVVLLYAFSAFLVVCVYYIQQAYVILPTLVYFTPFIATYVTTQHMYKRYRAFAWDWFRLLAVWVVMTSLNLSLVILTDVVFDVQFNHYAYSLSVQTLYMLFAAGVEHHFQKRHFVRMQKLNSKPKKPL